MSDKTTKIPGSGSAIQVHRRPDDTDERTKARAILRPSVGAAVTTQVVYGKAIGEMLDVSALSEELADQCDKVRGGDMGRLEAMLVAQAHTLDALFNRLTQRAMGQEYLKQFDCYMRLALKAQAQARATVEALAEIKNPRPAVAFVRQANVGANVQVNNGLDVSGPVRAGARGNVEIAQDGLLEADANESAGSVARGCAGDRMAVGGTSSG